AIIAIVDRGGRVLGVRVESGVAANIRNDPVMLTFAVDGALAEARTGAFFSHNQAALSSRTVRTLSRENFPEAPNQPAAALFGIENTNRGCGFNAPFLAEKDLPPARNLADGGPGLGITTIPGGIPLFKNALMVGGVGVAGIDSGAAEFAAVSAAAGFFDPPPAPPPGAIFVDGIRLPYVQQTSRPAGTQPATSPSGAYALTPRDGSSAPDGYLIGPRAGVNLSAADAAAIVQRAVETANRTRAVIRLPLGSRTRMVMAVTDVTGTVLALYRMPDATVFSADVAVAKARNVTFFSSTQVDPADLPGLPPGTAVTNRSIGFGSQSFFPSGIAASSPGPFRALFRNDLANPCTQGRQPKNPNQNGIVFFPGSAPLYRGGALIGGFGVSGDGVEQDDYVTAAGVAGFEPAPNLRADQFIINGARIPYWKFPRNPEQ
ncbi:MAG: heme-binding protein, partial [Candidatus Solibacter usitatus]|nr:heme-binding protein [Candidatus Solibacter usitatus]